MKKDKLSKKERYIYFSLGVVAGVALWWLTFMVLLILN